MTNRKEFIGYPELDHPLTKEKIKLKNKYLDLMTYFANKYMDNETIANKKVESLAGVILNHNEYKASTGPDPKRLSADVLKTRFSFYRFFSYRYLFLFDSLLLFAADDKAIAEQIKTEFNSWIDKRFHKKSDNLVQLMYQGDIQFAKDTLITDEMIGAWKDIRSYFSSDVSRVFFTATMSAGKSTLINAVIGQQISNVKNAACTSNILKFRSLPLKSKIYTLYNGESVIEEGSSSEIRESMKKWKRDCDVYGYFNSILSTKRMELIDTPGINSSRNPEHKKTTRDALKNCERDLLIYVIPVENYGAEDDYHHLVYILKHVKFRKIIFLVNMIDTCDFEDDSLEQILLDVKEHLGSIGYENPEVYPISAKAGLEIKRRICKENVSDNEKNSADTFIKMFVKEEFDLSRFYGKEFWAKNIRNDMEKAYENTGIPAFERMLNTYR